MLTAARPAYRAPWTHGAYAYPQADTLDAMWEGVKRKRKPLTVHVAHAGLADRTCTCGVAFDQPYLLNPGSSGEKVVDTSGYAYVDVDPRKGTAIARHYYCAWQAVMAEVMELHRIIRDR